MCNSLLCGNTYTDSLALAFVHIFSLVGFNILKIFSKYSHIPFVLTLFQNYVLFSFPSFEGALVVLSSPSPLFVCSVLFDRNNFSVKWVWVLVLV